MCFNLPIKNNSGEQFRIQGAAYLIPTSEILMDKPQISKVGRMLTASAEK